LLRVFRKKEINFGAGAAAISRIHLIGNTAITLTDDYNPIDIYNVWENEWGRTLILQGGDRDV
jgi:hypothetical protein